MLLTREDKRSLGNMHLVEGHDSAWVSWNYGIKPDTLRKWIHIVRQDISLLDDCGRSRLFSAANRAEFELTNCCRGRIQNSVLKFRPSRILLGSQQKAA